VSPYANDVQTNGVLVMTVAAWVDSLQARGRYTFLRAEVIQGSGLSAEAVKKALQRLARRRRVAKVKNYFYVIVPLEYRDVGGLPPSWFIDDLMKVMERPYYVGLLSAAGIHGASHHQPQEFQVFSDRPIRPLKVGRTTIRFFANQRVSNTAMQNVKTATGTMRVSISEATAVDLVRFAKSAGHLDNVATVLAELVPLLEPGRLLKAVRAIGDIPNAQRLGYLLERVGKRPLAKPLHDWLRRQSTSVVPLRPGKSATDGAEERRWHVLVNDLIEVET
jgi:predicted transcriptional regulator of viral defense system